LTVFGTLSLTLHAAVFVGVERSSRTASHTVFDASSQPLTGDTLDVDTSSMVAPADDDWMPGTATAAAAEAAPAQATPMTHVPRLGAGNPRPAPSGAAAATAASEPPRFGAVGVRFATDLATTFTRAFPQAGSAEPMWYSAPFGSAGRAEVALVLSDEGYLVSTEISGSPSSALRRSIDRTLLLLAPRTFTARGLVTRLRIAAHVCRDDVHDGLHGDVFALSAGSFSGDIGSAFFALPPAAGPGRRVDVQVNLVP
jgi:hypothetical protein